MEEPAKKCKPNASGNKGKVILQSTDNARKVGNERRVVKMGVDQITVGASSSESTIYKNVVEPAVGPIRVQDVQVALDDIMGRPASAEQHNCSGESCGTIISSEEELINTSDENSNEQINAFLLDVRKEVNEIICYYR